MQRLKNANIQESDEAVPKYETVGKKKEPREALSEMNIIRENAAI
jgi:hypothetical protein